MKKVDDVCDVCIIIYFLPPLSFFFIRFPWNKGTSKAFSQIRKGVGYFQIGCCYSHGTTRYIYHHKSYKKKLQFFGWKSPPTISIFFQCLEHVLLIIICMFNGSTQSAVHFKSSKHKLQMS